MAKPYRILCFVLLCLQYQTATSMTGLEITAAIGSIASTIIAVSQLVVQQITILDRKWSEPAYRGEFVERPIDLFESHVMDQLRYLAKQRDQLMTDVVNMKNDLIYEIEKTTPGLVELNRRLTEIFTKSSEVNIQYNNFVNYYNDSLHDSTSDNLHYDKKLLVTFAEDSINMNKCNLQRNLYRIHSLVTNPHIPPLGTVNLLATYAEIIIEYANLQQSPQQFIYNILISIIYTQLKGYVALTYSYRILQKYNNANITQHLLDLDQGYSRKINETISAFKTAIAHAPREIWKNNPLKHEEDETFVELKNVFSRYFLNAYDLKKEDNCNHICDHYKDYDQYHFSRGDDCYYDLCKKQRQCNGVLYDCGGTFDEKMTFCLEDESDKRYRSLVIGSTGERYGSNKTCAPEHSVPVDKKQNLAMVGYCYPCKCVCDEIYGNSESIRFFNLQPSVSRFNDNYVMTGMRFVKHGDTIYTQIKEGQLLPNGRINESTVAWVPVNTSNRRDEHTLRWYRRRIVLEDIEVPKDSVLVGVKFWQYLWKRNRTSDYDLRLKIMHVPINFTSGSVLASKNYKELKAYHNYVFLGSSVEITDANIPTSRSNRKVVKSKRNQWVDFTTTGLDYDVGQTTIPFIDIQPVVTEPPAPLAGAGIYHKAVPGTGGFIAPRIFTYDFEPHLKADISDDSHDISSLKDTVDNEKIEEKILNNK